MEADCPLPEFITNDNNILDMINKKTATENLQFLLARRSAISNILVQTNPTMSADQGATLFMEIAAALDPITIEVRSIQAKCR
ncbi:hypothetical protein Q9L58_010528 [Maublancomyces gigas]|uniref:Chorismate mutase n=1 Tax=Discina gigas TaxID=1032678 RepID=A0ABR3G481_9PEZI